MSELESTGRPENIASEMRASRKLREQADSIGLLQRAQGAVLEDIVLSSTFAEFPHGLRDENGADVVPVGAWIIKRVAACQLFVGTTGSRFISLATDVAGPVTVSVKVVA